jgi:hypothetical protein
LSIIAAKDIGSIMSSTSEKEKWELLHIAWIVQFESNADIPTVDPKVLIK